jgi:hypothetical protein
MKQAGKPAILAGSLARDLQIVLQILAGLG